LELREATITISVPRNFAIMEIVSDMLKTLHAFDEIRVDVSVTPMIKEPSADIHE